VREGGASTRLKTERGQNEGGGGIRDVKQKITRIEKRGRLRETEEKRMSERASERTKKRDSAEERVSLLERGTKSASEGEKDEFYSE